MPCPPDGVPEEANDPLDGGDGSDDSDAEPSRAELLMQALRDARDLDAALETLERLGDGCDGTLAEAKRMLGEAMDLIGQALGYAVEAEGWEAPLE